MPTGVLHPSSSTLFAVMQTWLNRMCLFVHCSVTANSWGNGFVFSDWVVNRVTIVQAQMHLNFFVNFCVAAVHKLNWRFLETSLSSFGSSTITELTATYRVAKQLCPGWNWSSLIGFVDQHPDTALTGLQSLQQQLLDQMLDFAQIHLKSGTKLTKGTHWFE